MPSGTLTRTRPRSPEAPAIDPRLADRRQQVERDQHRRRRRTLLVLLVVTIVVVGALGLTRTAALDVDHVEVSGADRTSVDEIVAASGVALRDPLTTVDVDAVHRRVAELPWVAEVRVVRQWPGTVSIAVRERTPAATVATDDGGWALVDTDGRVLERRPEGSDHWVAIEGVPVTGDAGESLPPEADSALLVASSLPEVLRDGLAAVVVEGDEVWLRFATGPRVRLGQANRLDEKFDSAIGVFTEVDPRGIDVVDVRVPGWATVRRVPGAIPTPEETGVGSPVEPDGTADVAPGETP